jgi:hypothetical protein
MVVHSCNPSTNESETEGIVRLCLRERWGRREREREREREKRKIKLKNIQDINYAQV